MPSNPVRPPADIGRERPKLRAALGGLDRLRLSRVDQNSSPDEFLRQLEEVDWDAADRDFPGVGGGARGSASFPPSPAPASASASAPVASPAPARGAVAAAPAFGLFDAAGESLVEDFLWDPEDSPSAPAPGSPSGLGFEDVSSSVPSPASAATSASDFPSASPGASAPVGSEFPAPPLETTDDVFQRFDWE